MCEQLDCVEFIVVLKIEASSIKELRKKSDKTKTGLIKTNRKYKYLESERGVRFNCSAWIQENLLNLYEFGVYCQLCELRGCLRRRQRQTNIIETHVLFLLVETTTKKYTQTLKRTYTHMQTAIIWIQARKKLPINVQCVRVYEWARSLVVAIRYVAIIWAWNKTWCTNSTHSWIVDYSLVFFFLFASRMKNRIVSRCWQRKRLHLCAVSGWKGKEEKKKWA